MTQNFLADPKVGAEICDDTTNNQCYFANQWTLETDPKLPGLIKEDFTGAGDWLSSQPLGPAYDEAIQDYAMSAAKDNPEAALAWVDRISDDRIRNYTLGRLTPKEKKE